MNRLDPDTRARIITSLVEGNSIASTCRMTGAAKMTVLSLIRDVGTACQRFHDARVRRLRSTERVQCDEVWSFCYAKDRHLPEELSGKPGFGSIWTWTALDADSKLLISWIVSDRSQEAADAFVRDLESRTLNRIQITTDGRKEYIDAIAKAFQPGDVHYAEVHKTFHSTPGQPKSSPNSAESRYSPGSLVTITKHPRLGSPVEKHISTSFMERWNLTLRMQNRRFTRLTNAFSKKFENHCHMLAISAVYYNFCRSHQSLKGKTPAQAAGLTEYRWTASDLLALDMWFGAQAAA